MAAIDPGAALPWSRSVPVLAADVVLVGLGPDLVRVLHLNPYSNTNVPP